MGTRSASAAPSCHTVTPQPRPPELTPPRPNRLCRGARRQVLQARATSRPRRRRDGRRGAQRERRPRCGGRVGPGVALAVRVTTPSAERALQAVRPRAVPLGRRRGVRALRKRRRAERADRRRRRRRLLPPPPPGQPPALPPSGIPPGSSPASPPPSCSPPPSPLARCSASDAAAANTSGAPPSRASSCRPEGAARLRGATRPCAPPSCSLLRYGACDGARMPSWRERRCA